MKLGIFSDLHLEFENYFVEFEKGLTYLNAGDTHNGTFSAWANSSLRDNAADSDCLYYTVMGNHDYYKTSFPQPGEGQFISEEGIGGCTLWTKMSPVDFFQYKYSMRDCDQIRNLTPQAYKAAHESDLQFLIDNRPEIIVTHHSPSSLSTSPRFKGDALNKFFHNDLEDVIMDLKPRLWVHGHTHDACDYYIGKTRVVCNPKGYPGENKQYSIKRIDL